MCDERSLADQDAHVRHHGALTRREFGMLTAGAGLAALWPELAHAAATAEHEVLIETPDGKTDAFFVHPAEGRHPGVILWPDAFGLRPAMRAMAKRLATSGYAVLAVNPYYRTGKAPLLPEGADFGDPETRKQIFSLMGTLSAETHTRDARVYVDWLDAQSAVDTKRPVGTLGYCMGGPITIRTAAARPDRVGATASFHGGRLVTDTPDSPHLLVPKLRARALFAIAENDDQQEPEAKDVLRKAYAEAGLPAEIEVYAGALHGWCPPDSRVYHEAQAERAWSRLLALFDAGLA
jgi:carboxymethylenebutenolidase